MSADVSVLATVTPGFKQLLAGIVVVLVVSIVLAVLSARGSAHVARRASAANRYLLLTVIAVMVMFPVYMVVVTSLLSSDVIGKRPPTFFPTHPLWGTYADAWSDGHIGRYLFNSFLVTFCIVAGQVVTA